MNFDTALLQHPGMNLFFGDIKQRFNLTNREKEVLQLLSLAGASNRELGSVLHISERTAKNHVASIQVKLKVRSSRELQAVVFRDTLLPDYASAFLSTQNKPEGIKEHATLSS
jgi:DNA-binding CsgD family transcriptional regulator